MIKLSIRNKIKQTIEHLNLAKTISPIVLKQINTIVDCTKYDAKLIDGCILINDKYHIDDINELNKDDIFVGEEYVGFVWQFNNHVYSIYLFTKDKLIM